MIDECIILAGGLGTRLRPVVSELPKCMASVGGRPFLAYVIEHFQNQGIKKFIFAVGYKSEAIIQFLKKELLPATYEVSAEEEPLGTGGAIKLACSKVSAANVLVVNGDTLFSIEVAKLSALHEMSHAHCTVGLKPMENFDRYGVVELDENYSIKSFKEKHFYKTGLINGGVYALRTHTFLQEGLPDKFSFEKDYLEAIASLPGNRNEKMYGSIQDRYFIDIGIPEDYERAQIELCHS